MRHSLTLLTLLMLTVTSAAHSQAGALPGSQHAVGGTETAGMYAADKVTLEAAVKKVRKQYGGRILSAETRGSGDRRQHVIKVLTDAGKVRTVRINAN